MYSQLQLECDSSLLTLRFPPVQGGVHESQALHNSLPDTTFDR